MQQRITVVNHDSSVEVIKELDSSHVEFNDVQFDREDFCTSDMIFMRTKFLRIHYGQYDDSKVFNYHTNKFLNVYATPDGPEEMFREEITSLMTTKLGLSEDVMDKFISSGNSLYLHLHDFDPTTFEQNLSELLGRKVRSQALDFTYAYHNVKVKYINSERGAVEDVEGEYKEIGIFNIDENSEPDNIILSGGRVVLNDEPDEHPFQKTLIHVAPKYRDSNAKAEVNLVETGLHPKMTIKLDAYPPHKSCELFYYLTLDKAVFIDEHNFGDGELIVHFGPKDLELPDYEIKEWGNEIMAKIPRSKYHSTVDINLHLRYRYPNASEVTVEGAQVFFGCDEEQALSLIDQSPFANLFPIGGNHEAFFTNTTSFYKLNQPKDFVIAVPTLDPGNHINTVSLSTVVLGLLIILFAIFRPSRSEKTKDKAHDEKEPKKDKKDKSEAEISNSAKPKKE